MSLERFKNYRKETNKKWSEKWFTFITSKVENWIYEGRKLNHDISIHPNITLEFVEEHPEYPWNWEGVSQS